MDLVLPTGAKLTNGVVRDTFNEINSTLTQVFGLKFGHGIRIEEGGVGRVLNAKHPKCTRFMPNTSHIFGEDNVSLGRRYIPLQGKSQK